MPKFGYNGEEKPYIDAGGMPNFVPPNPSRPKLEEKITAVQFAAKGKKIRARLQINSCNNVANEHPEKPGSNSPNGMPGGNFPTDIPPGAPEYTIPGRINYEQIVEFENPCMADDG